MLQVRERLLILPIIGILDTQRARQLTEQLLGAIQANRAKVVVIDITGVATIDVTVANHLVQTVEAARLMGASAIITGLSSQIAQTLVDLGVDLSMMRTVGDLQGGLEEAERLLRSPPPATPRPRRPPALSGPPVSVADPATGRLPHRLDPVGPHRRGGPGAARRPAERVGRPAPAA